MIKKRLWVAYPELGIERVEEREYNVSSAISNHRRLSMSDDDVDYQAYDESEALMRMIADHQKYRPHEDLIIEGGSLKLGATRPYTPPEPEPPYDKPYGSFSFWG